MLYYYLLFFFIAVGAKFILALVMIYLLLPADHRCGGCDEETLLLEGGLLVRAVTRLSPGRLQRRWCPRCGQESFARPPFGSAAAHRRRGRNPVPIHVNDVDYE